MKMDEKVIEKIIEDITNMDLPDFHVIKSTISTPYIIDEDQGCIGIDIKVILKEKKKKKPKEEAKRISEDMFEQSQYGRIQIGGEEGEE